MLYHRNKAFHQVHKFKLGFLVFSLAYRMKYCKKINFHYWALLLIAFFSFNFHKESKCLKTL